MKDNKAAAVWWGMAISAACFFGLANNLNQQSKDGIDRTGNILICLVLGSGAAYSSYQMANKQ